MRGLLGRRLERLTPNTITTVAGLLRDLDLVRRRGSAINDEETALGLRSVAAAVLDGDAHPVAALNVAVPSADWSRRRLEQEVAPLVVQAAAEISAQLKLTARRAVGGRGGGTARARSVT